MKIKIFISIILSTIYFIKGQSASEIKQAKNLIKESGITENEARSIAKSQGYSDQQIEAVIKKEIDGQSKVDTKGNENIDKVVLPQIGKSNQLEQIKPISELKQDNQNGGLKVVDEQILEIISDQNLDNIKDSEINFEKKTNLVRQSLNYFGYDIFKQDPALFQATSVGVVDPNYLIGPGDEIIVMLWGETQFRQVLTVDREGFIFIPEIGQVFVNGLNLKFLESKLFRVLSQSYSSLNPAGRKATTFLDVSLGNLRPLRIQVLGEVAQPGAYTVSPSATLFSALYYFNGPTTLGSLRDIRLIRNGKEITSIDFYDYLLTGKKPKDEKLQLDDVIFIPNRNKAVSIEGEVNRPGIYELIEGETLSDIIVMSGDLKITAYLDRAQIDRIVPFDQRAELGMDRMFTDVNIGSIIDSGQSFPLQDGDRIQIFSVMESRQNVVEIRGSVTRPGSYDIGESLKLSELIIKADSLLGDAYLERVDIVRKKPDFTEELIKLDLSKALQGKKDHDIYLKSLDQVRVYGMTEMIPKTYVSISGHVKRPGRYLLQENMSVYDLIFKAGGFTDPEFKKRTYLKRAELVRVKEDGNEKEIIPFNLGLVLNQQDLSSAILKTDDAIRVYSIEEIEGETRYVSISGHVKRPGQYELYEENMTLYDLIFKAGGFTDSEFKKRTYLKRAELVRVKEDSNEKEIIPFDLGSVLSKKEPASEILRTNDAIRVYSIEEIEGETRYVSISGHVKRPGQYELFEENMTLYDLIFKAGGFDDQLHKNASLIDRADLIRYDDNNITQKIIPFNLGRILENKEDPSNIPLIPGDEIRIYSKRVFNDIQTLSISGSIRKPGRYNYKTKMTLKDLILEAGGVPDDVHKYRVEIARIDPNSINENIYAESIVMDMNKDYSISLYNNSNHNYGLINSQFILLANDFVSIRPDPYFQTQKLVSISGPVYYPGSYVILSSSETIADIVNRAGGLRPNAYGSSSQFIRNGKSIQMDLNKIIKNPKSRLNIQVLAGDAIMISKKQNVIEILGEINAPGFYKFVSGMRVNDVIRNAGGFTPDAEYSDIYISYPNGKSKKYSRWLLNPKVLDGSIITVGAKPEELPFDKTEYAKNLTAILASLAQTISILVIAYR